MRALFALLSVAILTACAGYETGPDLAARADPVPAVTNDGFHDGGIFDQDRMNSEPGNLAREPL